MFNYKKFKNLRKKNNLLQSDIAKKINVSASTIGMWEQGRNQPDNDSLIKIANIFNVSTDYLLDNDLSNIDVSNDNKKLVQSLADGLSDPLNKALYSKACELKNDRDKEAVLKVIEAFISDVDKDK